MRDAERTTIAYARVSSHDQKDDLERQKAVLAGRVGRLVITHKDRLLRFVAELVFAICEAKNVEVVY
jgi:predicted site-specific integrase-resolvase